MNVPEHLKLYCRKTHPKKHDITRAERTRERWYHIADILGYEQSDYGISIMLHDLYYARGKRQGYVSLSYREIHSYFKERCGYDMFVFSWFTIRNMCCLCGVVPRGRGGANFHGRVENKRSDYNTISIIV